MKLTYESSPSTICLDHEESPTSTASTLVLPLACKFRPLYQLAADDELDAGLSIPVCRFAIQAVYVLRSAHRPCQRKVYQNKLQTSFRASLLQLGWNLEIPNPLPQDANTSSHFQAAPLHSQIEHRDRISPHSFVLSPANVLGRRWACPMIGSCPGGLGGNLYLRHWWKLYA
jgi:hypothetical protein